MLCTECALALDPLCVHVNPEGLLMPFLLMWDLRKLNLWGNQCCVWVNTFIWLNLDCVSLPYLVFCFAFLFRKFMSLGKDFSQDWDFLPTSLLDVTCGNSGGVYMGTSILLGFFHAFLGDIINQKK